jgi:hypothetical protein
VRKVALLRAMRSSTSRSMRWDLCPERRDS